MQEILAPGFKRDLPLPCGTPDDVVAQVVYSLVTGRPALIAHIDSI